MKMFKKVMALTLAVLMLLTSMSLTSFAAVTTYTNETDKNPVWLVPYSENSKIVQTELTTTTYKTQGDTIDYGWSRACNNTTANFDVKVPDVDFPADDYKNYAVLNHYLDGSVNLKQTGQRGFWYKVKPISSTTGLVRVQVQRFAIAGQDALSLEVRICDDDGKWYCPIVPPLKAPKSGWVSDMYDLGVYKISKGEGTNHIRFEPIKSTNTSHKQKGYINVGVVKLTPVTSYETSEGYTDVINDTKWLYPNYGTSGTATNKIVSNTDENNYSTVVRHGNNNSYFEPRTITDIKIDNVAIVPADAPAGYTYMIRQQLDSAYTKPTGIEYKPNLSDTENPWYAVYVHRIAHHTTDDVPLNITIKGDDGFYNEVIPALGSYSAWNSDMYHVGNVKLSDKDKNSIGIFLPLDEKYKSTDSIFKDYFTIGAVKLVHIKGEPTACKLEPIADRESKWLVPFTPDGSSASRFDYGKEIFDFGWSRPLHESGISGIISVDNSFSEQALAKDSSITKQYNDNHYIASVAASNIGSETVKNDAGEVTGRNGLVTKETGYVYKPYCTNVENPYWKVSYEKVVAGDNTDMNNLHIKVEDDNGDYFYSIDNTTTQEEATGKRIEIVEIGTFKFTDIDSNAIRVLLPTGDYSDSGKTLRIGGIKIEPVQKSDIDYNKPVYTEHFTKGIPSAWTASSNKDVVYEEGSHSVKLINPENGTATFTLNYEEGAKSNEALLFNEGIMDIRMYWRSDKSNEYASFTFVKSADKSAELQIHPDGAKLIENGTTIELRPYADYTRYSKEGKFNFATLDQEGLGDRKKELRIEICDAPDITGTKILKIYIANRSNNVVPMAMGIIPATSCLVEADENAEDNKIIFKHNSTHSNGTNIAEISVSKYDANVDAEEFVINKTNNLKVESGKVKADVEAYYTIADDSKAQTTDMNKKIVAIVALYDANKNLCGSEAVTLDAITLRKGARVDFNFELDAGSAKQAKLFVWDDLDSLIPYEDMFERIPIQ